LTSAPVGTGTSATAITAAPERDSVQAVSVSTLVDEGDLTNRRDALRVGILSGVSPWLPPRPLPFDFCGAGRVTEPVLAAVADTVKCAQHLDDQHGGAARRYVGDQAKLVERMLRHDTYDDVTCRDLSTYLAQLAQTVGFMGHDAGADDQARTWYEYGLSAAHAASDRPLTASILSLMSNQAAIPGEAGGCGHGLSGHRGSDRRGGGAGDTRR
jgi:hypothetical protein